MPFTSDPRIFVVDDEPVIASSLGMIFSRQGYEVESFTDPLAALQAVQQRTPDLVIADVVMPKLSGIELAVVIREAFPSCKVLLFSGQIAIDAMLERARERGHHFEVMGKPIHPMSMVARVRSELSARGGEAAALMQ